MNKDQLIQVIFNKMRTMMEYSEKATVAQLIKILSEEIPSDYTDEETNETLGMTVEILKIIHKDKTGWKS